jgi:hypothetical protein
MEEHDYLQQLCIEVLAIDKNIRFAGVIQDNGLLVVGKYRDDIESPRIKFSQLVERSEGNGNRGGLDSRHLQKKSSMPISSFQASKMAFDLNRQFENDLGALNYQLFSFGKVLLVTIALTNRNDRYLCISIDPVPNSHDIVSRVLKSI